MRQYFIQHSFSKQSLLHSYQHSHIINTSLLTRHLSHCIQAGSGNPHAQKNYIEHFTYFSPSIHSKKHLNGCLNKLSSFIQKNNLLDANQSGFRHGHSTETALLSVTEALRIAKADSNHQFSFCWIYLLLLTLLLTDPLVHPSSLDITWIPFCWFESYLTGRSIKVAWGGIQSTSTGRWGSSGISSLDPSSSLHTLHRWVPSLNTWFLLPLLCWWYTALSLILTRWSNGSCTDLRLPGGHLRKDERTSPTA